MTRTRRPGARTGWHPVWCVLAAVTLPVAGLRAQPVERPSRGEDAPAVTLPDLDGERVTTTQLGDRAVVLIFGELYHEKTLTACEDIRRTLADDRFADLSIAPVLIIAQDAPASALRDQGIEAGLTWPVLHDTRRGAFGAYRVSVMPTVVVLDDEHRLVHVLAGYNPRFETVIADAMLVATGRMSIVEFDRTLLAGPAEAPSDERVRAERLANLARQLAQRGMPDMAVQKYTEAIELAPEHFEARIGLGMLRLRRGMLAEAEVEFRAVLDSRPESISARLGLAYLQALRGGDELAESGRLARDVLADSPDNPSAHYILGLVYEQRGEMKLAAASFKAASKTLMSRHGIDPRVERRTE